MQRNAVAMRKLREWARRHRVITASLEVAACRRIADLCRSEGLAEKISARWSFRPGPEGFPLIELRARGALHMDCRRCLAPVAWPIGVDCRLTAVDSENEIGSVASPYDTVVVGREGLMLGTMLEDEILISLPMAPAHSQCAVAGQAAPEAARAVTRPFAGLGALVRQGRG